MANLFSQDINPLSLISKVVSQVSKQIDRKNFQLGKENPFEGQLTNVEIKKQIINDIINFYDENATIYDRYKVANTSWKNYLGDGRISQQIEGVSNDATIADNEGHPYQIVLGLKDSPKPRIKKAFESIVELNRFINLEEKACSIIDWMQLEGSTFMEIVVNFDQNKIVDFKEVPGPREGHILKVFEDKISKQISGYGLYSYRSSQLIRYFKPWQIIGFHRRKRGNYGIPVLGPINIDIARIKDLEIDMHIARKERAYLRMGYIYKGASTSQIESLIKQANEKKILSNKGAGSDYYSNEDIKLFDPRNSQLAQIPDMIYHQNKLYSGTGRPKGLSGGEGEAINRSVLDTQEKAYTRFLSKLRSSIAIGYREIFNLHLLLNGYLPEEVPYKIIWTDIQPDSFLNTTSALDIARRNGLSKHTFLSELGFDPEFEENKSSEESKNGVDENNNENDNNLNDNNKTKSKQASFQRNGGGTITKRTESNDNFINRIRKICFSPHN